MDIRQPGGGNGFQQVHNLKADVPPANIVAMFDAALCLGVLAPLR